MRAEHVPAAEVDVCDGCGGLWIDWFDGDVPTLAAQTEAIRKKRGTPIAPVAGHVTGGCPHCGVQLAADAYHFPDTRPDELVDHAELLRCHECQGCFVTRSNAYLLLDRATTPRTVGLWQALVELLQRVVGPREGG